MKPVKLDLEIYKGSTYRKSLQWIVSSTNTPMDITACTIKMQIRPYLGSNDVLLELSTVNGRVLIVDGLLGKWQIYLTPAETLALDFVKAVYDLDITFPSTEVHTPIQGDVTLIKQVTV
jgi:hypothetical protein